MSASPFDTAIAHLGLAVYMEARFERDRETARVLWYHHRPAGFPAVDEFIDSIPDSAMTQMVLHTADVLKKGFETLQKKDKGELN